MYRSSWMIFAPGLVACATSNDTSFESSSSDDMEELSRGLSALTVGLSDDPTLAASGTFEGIGDCTWTWTVAGPLAGADATAAVDQTPCGGDASGPRGSLTYDVVDGQLAGTVGFASDVWSYDLTGTRTANLIVSSNRSGRTTDYTSTWTLDSLVGTTDGDGPGPYDAALTWDGWLGRQWDLVWSRSADGAIDGQITSSAGGSCVVSGTEDTIEVACEGVDEP